MLYPTFLGINGNTAATPYKPHTISKNVNNILFSFDGEFLTKFVYICSNVK